MIEIELTTQCNAKCPQCARNYYGSKATQTLPVIDIDIEVIKRIPFAELNDLEVIRLCGSYGDPILHKNLHKIVSYIQSVTDASIVLSTNGGTRSINWWAKLGSIMRSTDVVYFGIDGLEDTNHLHRIGVKFSKLIQNVKAFNTAGGNSVVTFLIFKHNEHQLNDVRKLSKDLGCVDFIVKSTSRFITRQHKFITKQPVLNDNRELMYYIEPTTIPEYSNKRYDDFDSTSEIIDNSVVKCIFEHNSEIYLSAEGYIFPCGWIADRMYGEEVEGLPDHKKLTELMHTAGDKSTNLKFADFNDIVFGKWFSMINDTFSTVPFDRCKAQCGSLSDLHQQSLQNLPEFKIHVHTT